ncbi:hypothetical protein ACFX1T_022505 [Malus domestica]
MKIHVCLYRFRRVRQHGVKAYTCGTVRQLWRRSFCFKACGGLPVVEGAGLPVAEGAGLLVAGLTAHQCLTESAGIKLDGSGQQKNILITAASGGVGQYAVLLQLEYTDLYNQQAEKQKQKKKAERKVIKGAATQK